MKTKNLYKNIGLLMYNKLAIKMLYNMHEILKK